MELIDRKVLREKAIECGKLAKQDPRLLVVGLGYVLNAPTIDAAPVVHGRWIKKHDNVCYWLECSECGRKPPHSEFYQEDLSRYCPNCGCKMQEGPDNE